MKRLLMFLLVCSFAAVPAISAEKTEKKVKVEEQTAEVEKQAAEAKKQKAAEPQATPQLAKASMTDEIVLYIPSRILDLLDMFTLDLKGGASAGLGLRITRAFGMNAEVGPSLVMFKDYNRQYGFGTEGGYALQFLSFCSEDMSVANPVGTVKEYWQFGSNFPTTAEEIYNWKEGARDYWAFEVTAECLLGVKFAFHPIECADFLTGIFLYDLKGDDLKIHPMVY